MNPAARLRCATFAGLVAAGASCTQASDDRASRPGQATGTGGSQPSHVPDNPVDAVPADSGAAAREDASTGDSPVADAGSDPTGRQFPDIDYDAFPPPPTAPLCPSGGMLRITPTETFFRLGASDTILGSVTPDGLTAAWTIPGSGPTPTAVFVADRESTSDAFGSPLEVDFGVTLIAPDKVALSPDRSRLVAVRSDLLAFVEVDRSAPTEPFATPSEDSFAAINAVAQATNDPLGDPTIAGDDRAFFYTRALAVIESNRSSTEPWPEGSATSLEYALNPGQRLRLSAVSEDHLTLFFWDDQRLVESATWRLSPSDAFRVVMRLPLVPRAQPSASCAQLFFASDDPGGVYLASATATFGP